MLSELSLKSLAAFLHIETLAIVCALVILPAIALAFYALTTSPNVHFEVSLHPLKLSLRTEGKRRKRMED